MKYINAHKTKIELSHFFLCEKEEGESVTLEEIEQVIDRMESADVVEVVKCGDCKYCTEEGDWCQNEKVRSMCCADGMVEHYFGENHTAFYPYMDFFCKYGERKGEKQNDNIL